MSKKWLIVAGLSLTSLKGHSQQTVSQASRLLAATPDFSEELLKFARKHLHIPYRSGGISRKGFDCSGFVSYCFNRFGLELPHSSSSMSRLGRLVRREHARPGDLIFFGGSKGKSGVGHVGIVSGVFNGKIQFIHSASGGGIRFDSMEEGSYYSRRFRGIRRVIGGVPLLAGPVFPPLNAQPVPVG